MAAGVARSPAAPLAIRDTTRPESVGAGASFSRPFSSASRERCLFGSMLDDSKISLLESVMRCSLYEGEQRLQRGAHLRIVGAIAVAVGADLICVGVRTL